MSDDPKRFLRQFPPDHQGAIGSLFYDLARISRQSWGEIAVRNVGKVCSVLFRSLRDRLAEEGETGAVSKAALLQAMRDDPAGAKAFMAWVLAEIEKPPEERQARRKASEEQGKREWMERQAPTQKQLDLLRRLGIEEFPENRWRASELIEEHRDW